MWYYFRLGYSTYLTFLLGALNTLTVVYYLLIRNVPNLQAIFPKFTIFAVVTILVGVPLASLVGWLHLKGTPAYTSEIEVSVEANPYNYKLAPGIPREVYAPTYLETLKLLRRITEREGLLTAEDRTTIEGLEKKFDTLLKGGHVGTPRRRTAI